MSSEIRFRPGKAWRDRYDAALAHGATMSEAIHAANQGVRGLPEMARHERILDELVACYGEGEDTDWPYLTDLADLIVHMIEREIGR